MTKPFTHKNILLKDLKNLEVIYVGDHDKCHWHVRFVVPNQVLRGYFTFEEAERLLHAGVGEESLQDLTEGSLAEAVAIVCHLRDSIDHDPSI